MFGVSYIGCGGFQLLIIYCRDGRHVILVWGILAGAAISSDRMYLKQHTVYVHEDDCGGQSMNKLEHKLN